MSLFKDLKMVSDIDVAELLWQSEAEKEIERMSSVKCPKDSEWTNNPEIYGKITLEDIESGKALKIAEKAYRKAMEREDYGNACDIHGLVSMLKERN